MTASTSAYPLAGLDSAFARFKTTAQDLLANYDARKPEPTNQVTPPQLVEALNQLFAIITKLDREEGETGAIMRDDVTQLGDYGLSLLMDLATWANQLDLPAARAEIEKLALAVADWVVRHEGRLRTLEPVVNALAKVANTISDAAILERLADFMRRLSDAAADFIKQDLEKSNPGRPWRILQLNRGIVATRSHNPALMEATFDELLRYLPEDAQAFFSQGMQQMEALDYPPHVREVMERYYQAWAAHKMH